MNDVSNSTDQLTLFAGDTHANRSPPPGSDSARTMTAISGRNIFDSYSRLNQVGLLAKMLLVTSRWGSTRCYLTWKVLVTPGRRLLFQLSPSMPGTDVTEFGLWATPSASQGGPYDPDSPENIWNETHYVRPDGRKRQTKLIDQVKNRMLPTPTACDTRDRGNLRHPAIAKRAEKRQQLMLSQACSSEPGMLNPTWLEWLMGYPTGWTDLEG